jgi:hypothetical protein
MWICGVMCKSFHLVRDGYCFLHFVFIRERKCCLVIRVMSLLGSVSQTQKISSDIRIFHSRTNNHAPLKIFTMSPSIRMSYTWL